MNQNQEKVISVLENFIDQIKNEQIEVYVTEFNNGGVIEHRINTIVSDTIITIMYKKIPPKLTQVEIYQELYDEKYGDIEMCNYDYVNDNTPIRCNQYATQNTVKVWREQWVK